MDKILIPIIILIIVLILFASVRLYGRAKTHPKTAAPVKTITSIETMTLTLHGMRFTNVYQTASKDGKTELSRFKQVYADGKDSLKLEASAVCDTAEFITFLNTCGVPGWAGFHGKHPKDTMDGIMFNFRAVVNGGQKICADGSANFPKGYHDFVQGLDKMLAAQETD